MTNALVIGHLLRAVPANNALIEFFEHFLILKNLKCAYGLGGRRGEGYHRIALNLLKYVLFYLYRSLREKCPYLELFWSAFSGNRTKYGEIIFLRGGMHDLPF